jgi:hypothetical protein
MARILWYLKQLTPRTYWTAVGRDGKDIFVIWKMWLGRCYDVIEFPATT